MNVQRDLAEPYRGGLPGNSECVNGWRGRRRSRSIRTSARRGQAPSSTTPRCSQPIKWTHWDDLRNVYGVDADGYAKVPWDNVGVQYGLRALNDGNITPAEFLKLNATVGSWKKLEGHGPGGLPVLPGPAAPTRLPSTRGAAETCG